jgi:hypothetical protein
VNCAKLDRGMLTLGNEHVRFSGWHGQIALTLGELESIEIGESNLAPRDGLPFVSKVWRGAPRHGGSLILSVRRGSGTARAVVGDLSDPEGWQQDIGHRQDLLDEVAAQYAGLNTRRSDAVGQLKEATAQVQASLSPYQQLEAEIATLQKQLDTLRAQQRAIDEARKQEVRAVQTGKKSKKR